MAVVAAPVGRSTGMRTRLSSGSRPPSSSGGSNRIGSAPSHSPRQGPWVVSGSRMSSCSVAR
eukprot:5662637-Alexandrium_andersonii.AAC.1